MDLPSHEAILLCLALPPPDCSVSCDSCLFVLFYLFVRLPGGMPAPKLQLYCVDYNALFSYYSLSEALLQRIWALYIAAHYKNSPNDLQMLSDAPAHKLFVLLDSQKAGGKEGALPVVLRGHDFSEVVHAVRQ
jgi:tRNA(Met) C34 N-acetyltransferase TmcA